VSTLESHENSYVNSYDKETRDALDILNLRYAKGEITQEQYLKMKEDILRGNLNEFIFKIFISATSIILIVSLFTVNEYY
jgi:Predicted membrane protein (DUF2078).